MENNRLICIIWLLLLVNITNAQNVNTQGNDFWVSFIPNSASPEPKLEILVAGQRSCTGVATNPLTGWSTSFKVTPGLVTSVIIPTSQGMVEKENRVERKAIHVTTTDEVSLYASNFVIQSYDVANVLPTSILKDNYIAQSFYSGPLSNMNSKMLIVALENNTEIIVDPSGGLRGQFPSFTKKKITLNAGECYLFISARDDISGTSVNVKDGKKVAVFSGGEIQIPINGCCYDAVFEQCMPMAYWGKHFVVTASAMRTKDVIRITSLSSGCRISIDGKHRKALGAKKYFDYTLNGEKHEAIYISANKPISVCLYLTSASMGGIMGDPSMVNINPIEQQMDKVTFCSYNTAVSRYHYVNVVTQTSQVRGMTLDSVSIASKFKPVPQKKDMSYARISIVHGSHTLESSKGGFVAHIYGLGEYESYAYTVGSNSKVFNQFDKEGNLILSTIPDDPDNASDDKDSNDEMSLTYNHTDTLPSINMGNISVSAIKHGDNINGLLNDSRGLLLDPERFNITAESDYDYLFDGINVTINRDSIAISFIPRNEWCYCFVPESIKTNVILVPKFDEGDGTGRIVIPTVVSISKENTWISRCLWVLILMGFLFLLLLYCIALMKKNRFHKKARMKTSYCIEDNYREIEKNGRPLRKPGFSAWINRWFNPFIDERNTIVFSRPKTSPITFVASKSKNRVLMTESSFDEKTMTVPNYMPLPKDMKKKEDEPISISSGTSIEIKKIQGSITTTLGHLKYVINGNDDEKGFQIFIFLLIIMDCVALVILTFLLLNGL